MKPSQLEKKQRLLESAIALFMEKGIDETSVNDIVKAAKLAKGTFYIYYKDKSELIHEIVERKNVALMNTLIERAYERHHQTQEPWSCTFVKELIEFYEENPHVLKMIHRSFCLNEKKPLPMHELSKQIHHFKEFMLSFKRQRECEQEALIRFQLVLEMCAFVCYNAIFFHQPASFSEIKELFYRSMCESFVSNQGGQI